MVHKSNGIYKELNKVKIDLRNYPIIEIKTEEKENLKRAVLKQLRL
ncbi:hypothetical protein SAMN04487777_12030 [Priestia aryabhattai B8W22]|nr:hypothetical protein SAMN04487777_12030 [Priestia aryabhattai B8W22]